MIGHDSYPEPREGCRDSLPFGPLGYEGNAARYAMQARATKRNKLLENPSRR